MTDLGLAAGFPPADERKWLGLVEKVLAGRDFARALVSRTRDGIAVEPLYGQRDPGRRVGEGASRWRVFQRVDHPDLDEANRFARADVEGGADGLELVFPGAPGANGFGVRPNTLFDLERVLAGIDLAATSLRLDGGYQSRPALVAAIALVRRLGLDPASVDIVGQSDPANGLLADGRLSASYDRICAWSVDLAHYLSETGLAVAPFVADGRAVHAGGGSEAQELAYCLAAGIEHLRVIEAGGVPLDTARRFVTFSLAADADEFATISKLRAFRLLWARVEEACGLAPAPARVHAETAWRMMTRCDPWVNLLRTTVATAAAGLGGADSVTVLPFTAALGLPDGFARRLARNTQLVLIEEAGLARVGDPAAGSGYVEALTAAMAEAAWTEFQRIEAEGGIISSLKAGHFQARAAAVREARMVDVARRKEPLTGVSEYPFLAELPVATLKPTVDEIEMSGTGIDLPGPAKGARYSALIAAVEQGATIADMVATAGRDWVRATPLPRHRLAEPFERLRAASDAVLKATGRRPAVFLASLGRMADFAPRASFARNAFAAGGIEAEGAIAFSDRAAMAEAFRDSGARIACICGTDAAYGEAAADTAATLRQAGAAAVWLAGRPGEREAELRTAGVDAFIHAGCDILLELRRAHDILGIAGAGEDVRKAVAT